MTKPIAKAPAHLGKHGKKLWTELTEDYGIADSGGLVLVSTAAEALDRMRAAQEAIKKDGEVVKDRYGQAKVHPACKLELDSRNGLLSSLKQLNLDLEPLRDAPGRPSGVFRRAT